MGKNRDRESLIRFIVITIVHEIVLANTNRQESEHFLNSEVIEYRSQTEKTAGEHIWNEYDKKYIEEESFEKIKEKLAVKYSDVKYSSEEVAKRLKEMIKEIF